MIKDESKKWSQSTLMTKNFLKLRSETILFYVIYKVRKFCVYYLIISYSISKPSSTFV